MLKVFYGLCFLAIGTEVCFPLVTWSQGLKPPTEDLTRTIALNASSWIFKPGMVEFLQSAPEIGGITPPGPVMKITNAVGGAIVAKNADFSEGTIDFDIQPADSNFASFYFHWQDANETECFYFRTAWASGHPERMEGVQYTPVIKGVSCWNLLPHCQGNASFRSENWNHVRIQIVNRQMVIFVNSDTRPTLTISRLEGNTTHGSFAFAGQMMVAHLVVHSTPAAGTDFFNGPNGYDPTDNDPRYLRHWRVSQPDTIPLGIDFSRSLMPGKQTVWSAVQTEGRGLINLTRLFGGMLPRPNEISPPRRIVWLKTNLQAEREWNYLMHLGFTNEVWVFLNGQYLYIDKNYYDQPSMKLPRARVSIENCSFNLPLKAGANELLIGVGNDFFGWGIVARLDETTGVKIE